MWFVLETLSGGAGGAVGGCGSVHLLSDEMHEKMGQSLSQWWCVSRRRGGKITDIVSSREVCIYASIWPNVHCL